MSSADGSATFRPALLEGLAIVLAGAAPPEGSGSTCATIARACTTLGARVAICELAAGAEADGVGVEEDVERVLAELETVELLLVDGGGLFAACDLARAALGASLEITWSLTRALVERAYLPGGRGGRIVYLAPAPAATGGQASGSAATHADAARAGLENLARTLSIEWSRHGITTVAIAPGEATTADEIAALVAYLASPAGAYFSGCQLDLRGPRG